MTVPWTLQFSTHIINPSYLLRRRGGVLHRLFRSRARLFRCGSSRGRRVLMMGCGAHVGHAAPHVVAAAAAVQRVGVAGAVETAGAGGLARDAAAYAAGALVPGLLLLPTFVDYGMTRGIRRHRPKSARQLRQPLCRRDHAGAVPLVREPGNQPLHRDRRRQAARVLHAPSLAGCRWPRSSGSPASCSPSGCSLKSAVRQRAGGSAGTSAALARDAVAPRWRPS